MDEGAGMQDCVHQAAGDSSRALRAVSEETPCPEVKPCPFCGAEPTENAIEPHTHHLLIDGVPVMPDHGGSHVIECACGAGMIADTRDAVLAIWNRRPLQSQGREVPTGRSLNSGWIPVGERRPEIGTSSIVWIAPEWDALEPFAAVDRWDEWRESPVSFSSATVVVGEGWMESDPAEVTHWMPLPAPPTSGASSSMDAAPATGQSLPSEAAKPLASSGPDEPTPASAEHVSVELGRE